MENALGDPQTIVLLGGTSEIGRAIVERLATPSTATVVLAARDPERALSSPLDLPAGVGVVGARFDATESTAHEALVAGLAEAHGDLDVVVVAFGQLGDPEVLRSDPVAAFDLVEVNFAGAVSVMTAVADQFRRQGHGRLVVLSSVAGERVRKANYVYGATKAGLDGFAQGLGDDLAASGASVLIVRPGFVHSRMTEGLDPAPMATEPGAVAEATVAALRAGKRIVWAPTALRYVFVVLRLLPAFLWRRIKR